MRQYTIRRIERPAPLTGDATEGPWAMADSFEIDQYPWYETGAKQNTVGRLLYDDEAIYAQFQCTDRHISASVTDLNGPVCMDSCVEMFATIDPEHGPEYFNIEINCCGVFLVGYGPARSRRVAIRPEQAAKIAVATSIADPTKTESADDESWWAAAAVPFEVISHLAGREIRPGAAAVWQANFYRCGGGTDPQYACWAPIDTDLWPSPDFHRPDQFGQLVFE